MMMMSSNTVQSTACKSRGATTARLPLLLLILAASCRQPQSLPVLAAATSPTALTNPKTTLSKKKNLITIGHKFQSAAIATHNSIFQKAKQEEEEYDGDDDTRRSKKSSTSVDNGRDQLPTADPTYQPTSWYPTYYPTPLAVDGGADVKEGSEATQVPTIEPTTQNTNDPTSSIGGGAGLVTDVPTKPSISITHEPTAAWNGDGFSSQGNTLNDEEAEVATSSPTAQSSSTIPTLYKTSFLTPTPTWPTIISPTDSAKPVEKEAYESHAIALFPSQVPSEAVGTTPSPSGATSSVPSAASDDQDCPKLFDESAFYVEGDVISTQGPLYCRSKGCRVIYKCSSPTLQCNIVVPGKDYSEQGWVKVGNCGRLSMEEEQTTTAASDVPSSFSTLQDQVAVHQDVEESHLEDEATSRPSSHPTEWHLGFTPTLPTQSEHDYDSVQNSGLSVDLPRIICDISLSSSLTNRFEQEHILLVVMTRIVYDIFELHLSKEMYDLTGVSLSVTTKKKLDGDGSDESDAPSTIRLHAFFTGTASFSRSAPTQSDLIEVLLLHFSVDEFQHRLNFPLRLRTFDDPVKVNSVFFTLEDGSLVNAGYKNEKEELALPVAASDEGEEVSLSAHQVQIITIAITMVAMPFAFAAIYLIVLKNMDDEEEVVYQEADDEASSNESPPEDEEGVPPAPAATVVDTNESAAATAKVEINIPSTPSSAMMPLSDISESQSEWSSISDSFHYTMELESPAKVGLGIAAAGSYHYHQKGTPYVDQAAPFGLVPELWEHNDHLEVYEDYIIDV